MSGFARLTGHVYEYHINKAILGTYKRFSIKCLFYSVRSNQFTSMPCSCTIDFRNIKNNKTIKNENSKLFAFVEFFTAINLDREI